MNNRIRLRQRRAAKRYILQHPAAYVVGLGRFLSEQIALSQSAERYVIAKYLDPVSVF